MQFNSNEWALILGGSSGFGLAAAKELASRGMSICLVHRDRRGAMSRIQPEFDAISELAPKLITLNVDALSEAGMETVISVLKTELEGDARVKTLLHSIAFGNLKNIAPVIESPDTTLKALAKSLGLPVDDLKVAIDALSDDQRGDPLFALSGKAKTDALLEKEDLERTIYSMGTSLLDWTKQLFEEKLFAKDARVLGLTSEGNKVAWRGYAAVSCAKVALEAISRAIAVEFAPFGIRSNIIQAGVTDTPALKAIPGSAKMKQVARLKNPFGRLTTPQDVAKVVAMLSSSDAAWINGSLIHVDGGEHIASL